MAHHRLAIGAAGCAAMLVAASASAAMLHIGFDTVEGSGFGGDLDKYEQTDAIALPSFSGDEMGHRLDIPLTASTHPEQYVQLLIVELSATADGFLEDWPSFNAYFGLEELADEVFFSPTEKYFLVSNQLEDVVIDASELGLGPINYMRITDVTGSARPESDVEDTTRRYAQELFWWYELGDYVTVPLPAEKLSPPVLEVTVIPEPATVALLATGLTLMRRRRA